jgi:hypothetical protein
LTSGSSSPRDEVEEVGLFLIALDITLTHSPTYISRYTPPTHPPNHLLLDERVVARDEIEQGGFLLHDHFADLLDCIGLLALEGRQVDGWSR